MKPVNLIPQEQRRRTPRQGSGRGAHAVLGALAVLLAMVVAYVLTSNTVTERQNDAEAARVEADQLEAQATKKDDFTDFAEVAVTRTQSVASVAAGRFDWERFMRELARVMPAGSWLQSADASVSGDATADASAAAQGAVPTDVAPSPSATLVGCTPDQSDVARMMVRLRQLHRVEEVELNQSIREIGETEAASIDSCGANYSFDLTVKFGAASSGGEAPRGATRVPASLGGGS
jgi:Tfp pilus assembly protein PilN